MRSITDPDDSNERSFDSSSNDASPTSWQHWKRLGNDHFQNGNMNEALQAYRRCLLDAHLGNMDKSLILSNMVACRLQLGGPAHARAAVQDAKQCVDLTPTWSKAYYRLGSALSATGESNLACNALQTCLRFNPGFQPARQLLMRELRRESTNPTTPSDSTSTTNPAQQATTSRDPSNARPPPQNPNYRAPESQQQTSSQQHPVHSNSHRQAPQHQQVMDIDDQLSFAEKLMLAISRTHAKLSLAYSSQSETKRSLIKVAGVLIILYVAFGGRFGLEYLQQQQQQQRYGLYSATMDSKNNPYYSTSNGQGPAASSRYSEYDDPHRPSPSSRHSSYPPDTDDDHVYSARRTRDTGGSWWNWGSGASYYGNGHRNSSWGRSLSGGGGFSWSWIFAAGTVFYLYRHHGFYAAAMFVFNQYRFRNVRQHHGHGYQFPGWGGGMYGGGGRPRRERGWW